MVEKNDYIDYLQPSFYQSLRYSLPYINKQFILAKAIEADELTVFFDATPTLTGAHVISLGFIANKKSVEVNSDSIMDPIIVKMFQNEAHAGAKADAKLFIEILETTFEPDFEDLAKKILFVTSDNSNEANLCRRTMIQILDRKYPLPDSLREAVRCAGHVLQNGEVFWFSKNQNLKTCAELITQIFGTSSTNLSEIWMQRVKSRIKPIKGIRWHSLFFNVDVGVRNLNSMKLILEEFQSHRGSKTLLDLLSDKKLIGDLISTSLVGTYLEKHWSNLTKKQLKSDFIKELSSVKSFAEQIRSSDSVIELYEPFYDSRDFDQIRTVLVGVQDVKSFNNNHKRNFESVINYIVGNLKPNPESNLDKMIGKISYRPHLQYHKF